MKCFSRRSATLHEDDASPVNRPDRPSSLHRWLPRRARSRQDNSQGRHQSAPAPEFPDVPSPSRPITSQGSASLILPALQRAGSSHSLVGFTSATGSFHTAPSLTSVEFIQAIDLPCSSLSPANSLDLMGSNVAGASALARRSAAGLPSAFDHPTDHTSTCVDRRASQLDEWCQPHLAPHARQFLGHERVVAEGSQLNGVQLHTQITEAWHHYLELQQESRWLAADAYLRRLERSTGVLRGDLPHSLEASGNSSAAARAPEELANLQAMLQGMQAFESALEDKERYHQSSSKPLQIFYRRQPNSTVHQFRFIADFACGLVEVLALAREFDLISSWNWTVQDSRVLSERSDMDLSAYAVVRMPWPYHNRYATVRAQGGNCLQEDSCARVVFQSCPCDELPESAAHADRVEVLEGSGVKMEPCWTKQHGHVVEGCRVSVQMSVDPRMDVPAAIIKFVLTVVSPVVYRLAKHVIAAYVRKPGTPLNKRMQERKEFYGDVNSKVQQFLATRATS